MTSTAWMEESLLVPLAVCAFPTLACLLAQLLFPSLIMNDDAVIRTAMREIVLYRQLPGGRRVLTRVVGWRYSIHVRRSPAFKRRQRTLKQLPARGNKRRPLLLRLLKRLLQRPQPKDDTRLPSSPQHHSFPSNHPTPTTHHDHSPAP